MYEREATTIGEPHEACVEPPTEPATYEHQPLSRSLDEIRLLKLRKEEHGPVHCDIEVFPLEQAPEYTALSYRWGPPSPSHDIFIGNQRLKIRDTLHACLLELREDVDTWLWIDQICIAQADTAERNHQVEMMSLIYSNATSVITWLGDVPEAPPGEVDHFNDQELDAATIAVLLRNIYFTRLWIVQEILLAKSVKVHLNGKRCVGWNKFLDVWNNAIINGSWWPSSIPEASFGLLTNKRAWRDLGPMLEWTDCITSFCENICEDPRDKVYGMMGIVDEKDRFTVDYNKSVLEVYTDVFNNMWNLKDLSHPSHVANQLRRLGFHMGIEQSLIASFELALHHRYEHSLQDRVSAIRFKKADDVDKYDHWWYECDGKRLYFCPSLM